jgi:hypothetical protein
MTHKYIVAYVGGTTDEGIHSNWVPFKTRPEADAYVRIIKTTYDFSTISVSEILERHD